MEPNGSYGTDGLSGRLSGWVNDNIRIALLGPAMAALLVVFIYPAVMLVWLSLQNTAGMGSSFAPMHNYTRMFGDSAFWSAFGTTLLYSTGSLIISITAGLAVALALDKVIRQRLRDVYTTLLLLSWAVPLSIVGITWRWMFNGQLGVVNKLLLDLGLLESSFSWLGTGSTAIAIIILADAWARIPFATIVLLAGLQSIPKDMYDAARIDGATTWQRFRNVTLPYLRPSFFVAGLLNWMFAFRAFAIPYTTTGGGPGAATEVLAIYIQRFGVQLVDYGFASAVSIFLVAVTLLVATVYVVYILERMQEVEL
jgi:multiple sugar transport system permease protein